jgi:molybdenum cofactor guanylyltransferase
MGTPELLVGIFVGGASSRMGRPKGLLSAPDEPHLSLVERLAEQARHALPGAPCVLVGERSEYAKLLLPTLTDAASECGPLGGLVALLEEGARVGAESVLALACDHPYLRAALLARLATEFPEADIYCPLTNEKYEPLVARYRVRLARPFREALAERKLSLQPLLRQWGARVIQLGPDEGRTLVDWDTPEDLV